MDPRIVLLVNFVIQLQSMAFTMLHLKRHQHMGWRYMNLTMSYATFIAATEADRQREKRIWMLPRSQEWWNEIVLEGFRNRDWIINFRMTRTTFDYICQSISGELLPAFNPISTRETIPPVKQVAIAIFYLASCCEYRIVGELFGVGKTSVWRCVHRVVDAINDVLLPEWIRMPTEDQCNEIAAAFEEKSNIPQIIGCIDGTHIPVTAPSDGYRDYVNRKGWTSIVLQAVVDHKLRYRYWLLCIILRLAITNI